jgi:hypothetical protein
MAVWTPSSTWQKDFRKALKNAYVFVYDIDLLLKDYFGIPTIQNIQPTGPGVTYEYQLSQLITRALARGWLLDLVAAAQERRPLDEELRAIAEERGLMMTGPRLTNFNASPFEEMILENAEFINLAAFNERSPILQGQICRIEIPATNGFKGIMGSGFLVGSDLLLTNYHVIEPLLENKADPDSVTCLFDYKESIEGLTLNNKQGTEVGLKASDWRVDEKPPSDFDWNHTLGDASEDELDYGLVRLAEKIGEDPVGGDTADMNAQPRGWIDLTKEPPEVIPGNQVFLIQHPMGGPLQMSVGAVKEFNGRKTRLRYDANSKVGSSGSPCFNGKLELVGLHHAFDLVNKPPQWNQAIPFGLVLSELKKKVAFESPPV